MRRCRSGSSRHCEQRKLEGSAAEWRRRVGHFLGHRMIALHKLGKVDHDRPRAKVPFYKDTKPGKIVSGSS